MFTPYRDVTHFMTSTHAAWIGSQKSVYILSRGMFAQTGGPENLVEALARRIAALPDGLESPIGLTEQEFEDLMAFMHALTDPKSINLIGDVPDSVPSGLPVSD